MQNQILPADHFSSAFDFHARHATLVSDHQISPILSEVCRLISNIPSHAPAGLADGSGSCPTSSRTFKTADVQPLWPAGRQFPPTGGQVHCGHLRSWALQQAASASSPCLSRPRWHSPAIMIPLIQCKAHSLMILCMQAKSITASRSCRVPVTAAWSACMKCSIQE